MFAIPTEGAIERVVEGVRLQGAVEVVGFEPGFVLSRTFIR